MPDYQGAVFNAYPATLRNSVLWPRGATTTRTSHRGRGHVYPYFQICFHAAEEWEAGARVASGTGHYYSFILETYHLICLDRDGEPRGQWRDGQLLRADLANTLRDWTIASGIILLTRKDFLTIRTPKSNSSRCAKLSAFGSGGRESILASPDTATPRTFLSARQPFRCVHDLNATNIINGGGGRLPALPKAGPGGGHQARFMPWLVIGENSGGTLNHPAM